jgi:hypothetical protein
MSSLKKKLSQTIDGGLVEYGYTQVIDTCFGSDGLLSK